MQSIKIAILFILFTFLSGCASGSHIITENVRPAIKPTEVKIYLEQPSQYEIIGLVQAYSDVEFSAQAAQDRVINELKVQAAKIGANGVVVIDTTNSSSGGVVVGNTYVENERISSKGQAIYVTQE